MNIMALNLHTSSQKNILDLNDDAILAILSYLSYDEVAKLRLVCQKFNDICMKQLNGGFSSVKCYHIKCTKEVKAKLPRRKSQRLTHPLALHLNILHSIESHLLVLSNQYCIKNYFPQTEYYHFIPGKILDECYRILRELMKNNYDGKPGMSNCEVLKELRDLFDMAQEHFQEHILPEMERKQKLDSCDESFQGDDCSSLARPVGKASFFRTAFAQVLPAIGNAFYSSLSSMMLSLSSFLQSYSSASQQSGLSTLTAVIGQQQEEISKLKEETRQLQEKTTENERKSLEQDKLLTQLIEDLRALKQTAPDVLTIQSSATEPKTKQLCLDYDGDSASGDGAV